jgi:carbonic anhydrase
MNQQIFENNKKWMAEKLHEDPEYFEKLSKGQNPEYLYIGCSDSRVTAEDLMGVATWRGIYSSQYCQYGD